MSKIIVLGKSIETKEIFDIKEVEHNKRYFLNREAGFIIYLIDKAPLVFRQSIPYESYASEISAIKSRWAKLQKEVYDKWQADKTELQTFNII